MDTEKSQGLRIGITGQNGFIGTHLTNYFSLQDGVEIIPAGRLIFDDFELLKEFVSSCDVVIHLAALNRHSLPEELHKTNLDLVKKLIDAMVEKNVRPHVLFSSSTQEENDNLYGLSKLEGRKLFVQWANEYGAKFTGLVIPNVFGPFGNPYYNSVVATFSHQLSHGETPQIITDSQLRLIYVGELASEIWKVIKEQKACDKLEIRPTTEVSVSDILKHLEYYKACYLNKHTFPAIENTFQLNLFNTLRSYINQQNFFPVKLNPHADVRGTFTEIVKTELGGQFSYSTTHPGVTRGNHFHTRKIERFTVIRGKAVIELRRIGTSERIHFELDGDQPSFVDMPVWYTHNIKNTGDSELLTLFWINEHFNPDDPDTYFEEV